MRGSEIDIVQENSTRLYRTRKTTRWYRTRPNSSDRIVHGLQCEEQRENEIEQSDVSV